MSKPTDLVQGTLDLLLLKILALEPLNGWAISQRLKQLSSDVLQVSDGSLYPALHKLEQEGWVTAEWRQSENNRRAKFYALTRAGRRQLEGGDRQLGPSRQRHHRAGAPAGGVTVTRLERWLRVLWLRTRSLFLRNRVEQELADELAFFFEQEIERHVARGLT